ncbi:MAG: DinB family protein [Balneolaceae bacterium]|nr:DinB family protein [Balneolaceae bacterium]MBO6547926.1 DinB family protein [Balneolaceae bacterium]MBO6648439.1 DinB family protein [Balneolaceae bacterium]
MENWENEYPESTEYAHFYSTYVELVEKANIITTLNNLMHEVYTLMNSVSGDKAYFRYAPEKWTLKEVLGHMIETERLFSYRAFAISRGDKKPLPGMDQNEYMEGNNYNNRTLANLSNEYLAVRVSTIHLLGSMTKEMIAQQGNASGTDVTVRALAFIIAGHDIHHLNIIKEKYLAED